MPRDFVLWLPILQSQGTDALSMLIASIDFNNEQEKKELHDQRNKQIGDWIESRNAMGDKLVKSKRSRRVLPQDWKTEERATHLPETSTFYKSDNDKRQRVFSFSKPSWSAERSPSKQSASSSTHETNKLAESVRSSPNAFQQALYDIQTCNGQWPLPTATTSEPQYLPCFPPRPVKHVRINSRELVQQFWEDLGPCTVGSGCI